MAKVPYKAVPDETYNPVGIPAFSVRPNAEAWAAPGKALAGVGKAISGFGDMLAEHALKDQAIANDTEGKQLSLWADMEMGKKTVEFNTLEGENKVNAYPQYVKDIETIQQQGSSRASNAQVKRSYDNQVGPRVANIVLSGASQTAKAKKDWYNSTSEAKVNNAVSDTAANFQDDMRFSQNLKIADDETNFQSNLHGWSPELTQQNKLANRSKVYEARIHGISQANPVEARQFFEANRDNIDGLSQIRIDKQLLAAENDSGTRSATDAIVAGKDPAVTVKTYGGGSPMSGAPERPTIGPAGTFSPDQQKAVRGQANKAFIGPYWGNPGDANFKANHIVSIKTASGLNAEVNKVAAPYFQGFINELEGMGYHIGSIGGENYRTIKGTSTLSQHAFGNAIDINPGKNPVAYGKLITNLPPNVGEIAAKYGISWGGDWRNKKDSMHFEFVGMTPNGGGTFVGQTPGQIQGAREAYKFFTNKGMSATGAAALVGNLQQENFNFAPLMSHDGGKGVGLAGWNGDRRMALTNSPGGDTFEGQLEFMWNELQKSENKSYLAIQNAGDDINAATLAAQGYFRPGDPRTENRIKYARQTLANNMIGPQVPGAATATVTGVSARPGSGVPGAAPVPQGQEPKTEAVLGTAPVPNPTLAGQKFAEVAGDTKSDALPAAPSDPLTKDSGPDWLERAFAKAEDYARKVAPNNPKFEDSLKARLEQQYNQMVRLRTKANQITYLNVLQAVMGSDDQNRVRSMDVIAANPTISAQYAELTPRQQLSIKNQVTRNAKEPYQWTIEGQRKFEKLWGMRVNDQQGFLNLNADDMVGLTPGMMTQLTKAQTSMQQKAQSDNEINRAKTIANPLLAEIGVYEKRSDRAMMDRYNQAIGALSVKIDQWKEGNPGKTPGTEDVKRMTAEIIKDRPREGWTGAISDFILGGQQAFELPDKWSDPRVDGTERTADQWRQMFRERVKREPTDKDMYLLFDGSTK